MSVFARNEISRGVLVVMGSHCTGKTTLLRANCPGVEIQLEVAPNETSEANEMIEQILVSGRNAVVEFAVCDDPALLVQRMLFRAKAASDTNQPAIVHRLDEMAESYSKFPKVAQELRRQFDASVEFVVIDNSGRFKDAVFHVDSDASPLLCGIVGAQLEYFRSLG